MSQQTKEELNERKALKRIQDVKDYPMDNDYIWRAVEVTDFSATKKFARGGGFKGTAINPIYLAKRATQMFGPIGHGWGIEVKEERYIEGAPHMSGDGTVLFRDMIHVVLARFWYRYEEDTCEFQQYGQTVFVGKNKNGAFTDEEAPKKSLTDAMSKCLSLLGFSADVYEGKWDDVKYVNDRQQDDLKVKRKDAAPPPQVHPHLPVSEDMKLQIDSAKAALNAAMESGHQESIDAAKKEAREVWALLKKINSAEALSFSNWIAVNLRSQDKPQGDTDVEKS